MNHHHIAEAQDYQLVGQLAPEAEQALTHQKAWDGLAGDPPAAEQPIAQAQAHDTSFWNRRRNRQTLAVTDDTSFADDFFGRPLRGSGQGTADIPPTAGYALDQGYTQTPTAATDPQPFDQLDPGVIQGASAATERSGNAGFLEPAYRTAGRSSGTD